MVIFIFSILGTFEKSIINFAKIQNFQISNKNSRKNIFQCYFCILFWHVWSENCAFSSNRPVFALFWNAEINSIKIKSVVRSNVELQNVQNIILQTEWTRIFNFLEQILNFFSKLNFKSKFFAIQAGIKRSSDRFSETLWCFIKLNESLWIMDDSRR